MALEELQVTAPSVGWQDKATGSEASVCLGPWVLSVEIGLEFESIPSSCPSLPCSRVPSGRASRRLVTWGALRKGALECYVFSNPSHFKWFALCDHGNPDFCPRHPCLHLGRCWSRVLTPEHAGHYSPPFCQPCCIQAFPGAWPHRAAPD